MLDAAVVAANIAALRTRIALAAQHAGRSPKDVTLIAVSKTQPVEAVRAALAGGVADLGENRVQEAAGKIAALNNERAQLRWHLIGHLQRNKARQAAQLFDLVHSLDSVRLAEALSRHAAELRSAPLPVLLQVNVSGEESKEGFDLPGGNANEAALPLFYNEVAQILALPGLQLCGLMTIAPLVNDPEHARPTFRALRLLRDSLLEQFSGLALPHLSMGMSDDAEVAIAEGATMIRLGRAIFGQRA